MWDRKQSIRPTNKNSYTQATGWWLPERKGVGEDEEVKGSQTHEHFRGEHTFKTQMTCYTLVHLKRVINQCKPNTFN